MKLKKVEEREVKEKPKAADDGSIDVAAILSRRVALEFSDSESEDDDDDWGDDGDFSD